MTDSELAGRLPARLPMQSLHECQRRAAADLGGDFLIFKRVSYAEDTFIGYPGLDDDPAPRSWAAECRCTACRETFYLGWHSEPDNAPSYRSTATRKRGVVLSELDDSMCLSPAESAGDGITYLEDDKIQCPQCHAETTLKHASFFRSANGAKSKTWRVMWLTITHIDNLTTLVYWMITRTVSAYASATVTVTPQYAFVVGEKFHYFRFSKNKWKPCRPLDPEQRFYNSQGRKFGAMHSNDIPDFTGMSAEKTGLYDYLTQDGGFPVLYLKFWLRFPNIENLIKAGWTYTIDDAIGVKVKQALIGGLPVSFPGALKNDIRWNEAAPSKMLAMTRREIHDNAPLMWNFPQLALWLRFVSAGQYKPGETQMFCHDYESLGGANLSDWLQFQTRRGDVPLDKVKHYLSKQSQRHNISPSTGFRLLIDYRKMLERIETATGRPPADVELWPPHLKTAHDNASAQVTALQSAISSAEFAEVRQRWIGLEVSDGNICTRLPVSQLDLVTEGRTLCHCVGSYGRQHLAGKLIVFVRHARRPERPWFTLNVDTTGYEPRRIQLHGYGNEYAHGKTLHIPQAVRDFCDKWEKDVLLPTFVQVNAR